MIACPPPQRLELLLEETLGDDEQEALSAHVAACPQCQQRLELLTDTGASLSVRPRSAAPADLAPFLSELRQSAPVLPAGEVPDVPGYEILGEIGRGGMGVVYRARHLALNRVVALKMILAGAHAGPRDAARFRTEAEAVAALHHPNIVQVFDIGEAGGKPFLALEFVAGGSLGQHTRGAAQPVRASAWLIECLARAVHFAHQRGIVHRDIKPANILLQSQSAGAAGTSGQPIPQPGPSGDAAVSQRSGFFLLHDDFVPKLTDFGLAKRLDGPADATRSGELLGTPSYMAPEQARGWGRPIGPATDVYSLGAVLYELLTGRPPFKGATALDTVLEVLHEEPIRPARLRPDLPPDLETVCLKCLEKEPGRRYASASELADDLRRFRRGEAVLARPVGALARAGKWARRRPVVATLLALLVVVGLGAFAGITLAWRSADRDREQARLSLYHSRITRSQLHWRLNDLAGARRSLRRSMADFTPESGRPDPRGWEWFYLDGLYHAELLTVRHHHEGARGGVFFHPEGKWFASVVVGSGRLLAWDLSGKVVFEMAVPENSARLAMHPRGTRLAVGGTDGVVSVYEPGGERPLWSCPLHRDQVASLAFSPDGTALATAGWDGFVQVRDAETGKERHPALAVASGERVHAVAYRPPDGRHLVTGDDRHRIRVWQLQDGKYQEVAREDTSHKSAVYGLAFSPEGKRLATAGENGNVRLWEMRQSAPARGRPLPLVLVPIQSVTGHAGAVLGMAYSPDGRYLAYGGSDGTTRVWAVDSGVEQITFRSHIGPVEAVRFSPDGRILATCCPNSGRVKLWDLTRHPEHSTLARTCVSPGQVPVWSLLRHKDGPRLERTGPDIEALCFSADGTRLVSVTVGGKVQTWDSRSGVLQAEQQLPLCAELITPAVLADFGPGGRWLAGRARDDARLVKVWDVETGRLLHTLEGHRHPVFVVRASPDGKLLATAGCDRTGPEVRREGLVWEVATGRTVGRFQGSGQVHDLAFSPDGTRLAGGCEGGRTWVLDWRRGRKLLDAEHQGEVTAVAFSPDGKQLATAGRGDHTVRLWDVERGKGQGELEAPEMICSLAYSPDGTRLAGISRDSIRLWDVKARHEALTLRGAPQRHWDPPFNPRLAYSPDGARLAGTNWDESISVWEGQPDLGDDHRQRREQARRQAAKERAAFWHLQETVQCLKVKNLPAARFHLSQVHQAKLTAPLKEQRAKLQKKLDELDQQGR